MTKRRETKSRPVWDWQCWNGAIYCPQILREEWASPRLLVKAVRCCCDALAAQAIKRQWQAIQIGGEGSSLNALHLCHASRHYPRTKRRCCAETWHLGMLVKRATPCCSHWHLRPPW